MNKEKAIREAVFNGKKIRRIQWDTNTYIRFDLTRGIWINPLDFPATIIGLPSDDWEIYEEPRPKVKKWKWCIDCRSDAYDTTSYYTEYEAKELFKGETVQSIRKLEYTEQEFDA